VFLFGRRKISSLMLGFSKRNKRRCIMDEYDKDDYLFDRSCLTYDYGWLWIMNIMENPFSSWFFLGA